MTTGMTDAYDWRGRVVVGRDDEKIGKIDELYVDRGSQEPEWALVTTGLLGTRASFVPLAGARPEGENVVVSVTKEEVGEAPEVEAEGELSEQEEAELYRHYGIDRAEQRAGRAG
jgi:hypothetical protein